MATADFAQLVYFVGDITEQYIAGPIIPQLLIGIGLAVLSALIFRPKSPGPIKQDDPTQAHERGTFIPLLIGRRTVGAKILWVGDRLTTTEEEDAGGKGGDASVESTVYWERGIHAIAVGPSGFINGIYAGGELIPGSENLNRLTTPGGSEIDFGDKWGTCRIYWGDRFQGSDPIVQSKFGLVTHLPWVTYIVWDRARLGSSPLWRIFQYDCTNPIAANLTDDNWLGGSDAWLDDGVEAGANPAYALWQLLAAPPPHGIGINPARLDRQSFQAFGALCQSEHVPINFLARDGSEAIGEIATMMQDWGFMLDWCPEGKLAVIPIRKYSGTPPTLTSDLLRPPLESIKRNHDIYLTRDQLLFTYPSLKHRFQSITLPKDNDAASSSSGRRQPTILPLYHVTGRKTANRIASRRELEEEVKPMVFGAEGSRGLRRCRPGQVFLLNGATVRTITVKPDLKMPKVDLEIAKDNFDVTPFELALPEVPLGETVSLAPDLRVRAVELPYKMLDAADQMTKTSRVVVLRVRANVTIAGARVWFSTNGLSYDLLGDQNAPAIGGGLDADWSPEWSVGDPQKITSRGNVEIEYGPIFTPDDNGDIDNLQNLSSDVSAWRAGRQIAVINDELFYLREVVDVGGGSYQCRGMISARGTTRRGAHTSGSEIFIADARTLARFNDSAFVGGSTLYFKTQPRSSSSELRLDQASAVTLDVAGYHLAAIAPLWGAIGGATSTQRPRRDGKFHSGTSPFAESIFVEWIGAKRESDGGGAGESPYGTVMSVPTDVDGEYEIRFWKDPLSVGTLELIRTETVSTPGADGIFRFEYTRTMRVTDGTDFLDGSAVPPQLAIEIRHTGGLIPDSKSLWFYPQLVSASALPLGA